MKGKARNVETPIKQSLKESEARYRRLFEAAQDGILILDARTGMIEDVNPYLINLLGYSREEFVKKKLRDVGAFRDIEASQDALEALQENENIRYDNLPLKTKDGKLIQVEFVSNLYLVGGEKVIQCNIRNITRRKESEQEIVSLAKFPSENPNPVLRLSRDGIVMYANAASSALLRMWGCAQGDSAPRLWQDLAAQALANMKFTSVDIECEGKVYSMFVTPVSGPGYVNLYGRDVTAHKRTEQALHESEKCFRALIENSSDAITLLDVQGKVLYDSPAAPGMLGYASEDWIGRDIFALIHPDDLPEIRDLFQNLVESPGTHVNRTVRVRHRSGAWLGIEAAATNLLAEPSVKAIVLNYRNITDRKQAEAELRKSVSIFSGFLEQSEDAFMLTNEQGAVIEWSIGAEKLTGFSRDETIGKPLWEVQFQSAPDEFKSTEHYEGLKASLQSVLLTGRGTILNHLIESVLQRPNGTRLTVQTSAFSIQTQNGFLMGGILRDITERKQAEEALLASEARFRGLFEDSPLSLWEEDFSAVKQRLDVLREEGITDFQEYFTSHPEAVSECAALIRILNVNKESMRLFGANRKEELLASLDEIFEDEPVQAFRDQLIAIAASKTRFDSEGINKTLDGRLINIELHWSAAPGYEDSLSNMIVSMVDITERKRAEERIRQQLEHLTALSVIDRAIATNFDLRLILSEILVHVTTELGMDAADILIFNSSLQMLEYGAERGFHTQAIRNMQVRLGESYADRVAMERQLVQIPNLREDPDHLLLTSLITGENFVSYYGVPLIAKGQVKGVLEVFHRSMLEPDAEWLDFLKVLAGQAAIAIENSTLFESLQRSNSELALAYDATIEGWSHALDLRDKETEGHTQRVTEMTVKLARAFGMSDAELVQARWGALLHDIGKMGVPDGILLKPSPLTDEEWVAMKKHPTFAYEMLSPIRYLRGALDIPYCHHEQWDGNGYPRGLKGEQIPLAARIFAIVDVWDALNSDRPYRPAWPKEKTREHIRSSSGKSFDPQVVEAFLQLPL